MQPDQQSDTERRRRTRLIKSIVFVGGMSSIGIELSASRLLAPYFGDSTFIWANLIGLTMLYLSIGYRFGGRIADRRPEPALLFTLTAIAGLFTALIPVISRPILRISVDAFDNVSIGAFYGSLLGVLILFAVPMTLFGFVSPFAIRLMVSDLSTTGNTSGGIYALSTIGSIAGSFLPVIVLIPLVGTAKTFYIFASALVLLSLVGLLMTRGKEVAAGVAVTAVIFAVVIGVFGGGPIKPPYRGELVYETESQYNYIQVLNDDGRILLALNEGQAIHSIYDPNQLTTGGPWDYFTLGPLFSDGYEQGQVDSAAIIGLAGGTAARELSAAFPGIAIDGVEIDGTIADLGEEYFGLGEVPNLTTHIEDGRWFLERTDGRYDIVAVDAYHQPYIPFQLATVEFFELVRDHLSENGAAVINVGRTDTDFRLVDAISSTMRDVFPYVYAVDVERFDNTMLIGMMEPASIDAFFEHAGMASDGSLIDVVADMATQSGNVRPGPSGARVFTDDHAPIEFVTDLIILDAAREGD
jgi:predicted membrane-bound spermidine synthase